MPLKVSVNFTTIRLATYQVPRKYTGHMVLCGTVQIYTFHLTQEIVIGDKERARRGSDKSHLLATHPLFLHP